MTMTKGILCVFALAYVGETQQESGAQRGSNARSGGTALQQSHVWNQARESQTPSPSPIPPSPFPLPDPSFPLHPPSPFLPLKTHL